MSVTFACKKHPRYRALKPPKKCGSCVLIWTLANHLPFGLRAVR